MADTLAEFAKSLADSGVLSADDVQAFLTSLPEDRRPADAQALAKELVRAGMLTKFQASQVYQGKGKSLVLGEYVVLDRIGAGGMGTVLKARHRRMERVVALKVISPQAVQSPAAVQRLTREVRAAAKLMHPNIVTAFDASQASATHYLVMEFVDGQDLGSICAQRGPLPLAELPPPAEPADEVSRLTSFLPEEDVETAMLQPKLDSASTLTFIEDWLDLMPLLDLTSDARHGSNWSLINGDLVNSGVALSQLAIPVRPEGDYQLRVAFTRTSGNDKVALVIPLGTGDCAVDLGTHLQGESADQISGVTRGDLTLLKQSPSAIVNGQRHTATITSRLIGQAGDVHVSLDQIAQHLHWKGRASFVKDVRATHGMAGQLGLGVWNGTVKVHSIELRMLKGQARLLRQPPAEFKPPNWLLLPEAP
jgi:hypothetical protein